MSQQQTVLRVQSNIPGSLLPVYEFLDLYSDIPIKLNKSFAEIQDIAKKNTEYTIGLTIPGSKKNNRFFENFYNVDTQSLYFDATQRNNCDVLLGDEPLFRGFLRLNKVSVLNSKIEYDVTLFSTISNLFGAIGNNLLQDLDFNDEEYHFNHIFNLSNVTQLFYQSNFQVDGENPYPYIYPVVHNGYEYISGDTVNQSGTTLTQTRLYTSTSPISGFSSTAAAWAAGVKQYQINSPTQGLINNQLKPALSAWNLLKLIFKTYGYTIVSDFFNTPWMKSLYLYGYYSSEATKFSYKINTIQQFPPEGIELITIVTGGNANVYVCKLGTGIPCYSLTDINITVISEYPYEPIQYELPATIKAFTTGATVNLGGDDYVETRTSSFATISAGPILYLPQPAGTSIPFTDGLTVDFSQVIDINIKQIDILGSIAKKFNLVFISNPDNPIEIKIEPYDFYIGTGNIYDWTDKISYDKGWSVEPALNFVESDLFISDLEDSDEGNKQFKQRNNRIYGQMNYYGPTSFKSQEKKIETIFSPELIRKWDDVVTDNIGLPLGINYVANNQPAASGQGIEWQYKGVKTKPKLMFWLGGFNPFLDTVGENYAVSSYPTYNIYVSDSVAAFYFQSDKLPVISHTMPMGLADKDKITNDSLCILFNSEEVTEIEGSIKTYNTYTDNDAFNKFYNNRITNIYNPNTRFLSGYFNLKYNDVKLLQPNDIIKVQEQYFTWNKISEFNLTEREMTKVELIQLNVNPQTYPDRYFAYYYCDDPSKCYKLKTDFTNPNLLDTNFGWSVYYDHQVGSLSGQTSGFTSTFVNVENFSEIKYVPYTMYEISQSDYETSSCYDWGCDCLMNYIYANNGAFSSFNMPTYWTNSGTTRTGINVFNNCAEFSSTASTWGIATGSSINHGDICCVITTPTPTPTPTISPTPTPSPTPSPTPLTNNSKYMFFAGQETAVEYDPTIVNFYISNDYGDNWVNYPISTISSGNTATGFVMGYDGNTILHSVASAGTPPDNNVYLSKNGGITWDTITELNSSVTMSSDLKTIAGYGKEDIPYTGGGIFYTTLFTKISNDYGVSFTRNDILTQNSEYFGFDSNVTISQNGQYIMFGYAAGGITTGITTGNTYLSIDSGVTFNTIPSLGNGIIYEPSYVMSLNGQVQTASNIGTFNAIGKRNAISKDFGTTWSGFTIGGDDNIFMVAWDMSEDGKYMFISTGTYPSGVDDVRYWVSSNTGNTFTELIGQLPIKAISTISVSNDGQYVLAGYASGIAETYISKDYGLTFTNLNLTSGINSNGLNKFYGSPSPAPTATPTPTPTIAPTATPTPTPTPTFAPVTYEYNYSFNGLGTTRTKVVTGLNLTYSNGSFSLSNISTSLSAANRSGNEVDNSGDSIGSAGVSRSISRLSTGSGTVTINSSVITLYVNGSVVDTYNVTTPFTLTTTSKTNNHTFYGITLNYGDTVTVTWVENS